MNYREMTEAVESAKTTLRNADYATLKIAPMLVGKLRLLSQTRQGREALKALKRELTQYNASTEKWKN